MVYAVRLRRGFAGPAAPDAGAGGTHNRLTVEVLLSGRAAQPACRVIQASASAMAAPSASFPPEKRWLLAATL